MLTMVLIFGMVLVGCDTGSTNNNLGNNTDPKTLVIQNMPASVFAYGATGFRIGVFPVGTTEVQALNDTGIIAGLDNTTPGWSYTGIDPVNLTGTLIDISTGTPWTGNGIFTIFASLGTGGAIRYFMTSSVNIISAVTNIPWSNITEIFPIDKNNTDPKTLVIQNMPASVFAYGATGFRIGIFPIGTTETQALNDTGLIAGVDNTTPGWSYTGIDPVDLTGPLIDMSTGNPWTGNGTFTIFASLGTGGAERHFMVISVNIISAITNIPWASVTEI